MAVHSVVTTTFFINGHIDWKRWWFLFIFVRWQVESHQVMNFEPFPCHVTFFFHRGWSWHEFLSEILGGDAIDFAASQTTGDCGAVTMVKEVFISEQLANAQIWYLVYIRLLSITLKSIVLSFLLLSLLVKMTYLIFATHPLFLKRFKLYSLFLSASLLVLTLVATSNSPCLIKYT